MAHNVIFLDRDGCINVDHDEWWRADLFQLHDRVPEALKRLKDAGYKLALVTNQSGVEKGLYAEEEVIELHQIMQQQLAQHGAELDALAYCPHYGNCRKPKPGMAKQIETELGEIDYANSWMIGDKDTDVGFGKNNGTKTALIKTGQYWHNESELTYKPDLIVDSLFDFAQRITSKV